LFDIKRTFETGVDLGGGRGYLSRHILAETVKNLKIYDICPHSLEQANGTPGINIEKHLMTDERLEVTFRISRMKYLS
jgi:NADH dehydrogenase [ubiquinone] 1 alpha subcomplex assembly factor 5